MNKTVKKPLANNTSDKASDGDGWTSNKELVVFVPLIGSAIAIVYDVGFFYGISLRFFTLFSLQEHVMFALEIFPFAALGALILALIMNYILKSYIIRKVKVSTAILDGNAFSYFCIRYDLCRPKGPYIFGDILADYFFLASFDRLFDASCLYQEHSGADWRDWNRDHSFSILHGLCRRKLFAKT